MNLQKGDYRRMIFIILFIALFILVARLFYPFLTILVWSGLIYALLAPFFERLATRPDGSERRQSVRNILAGTFALASVIILVVPIFFLVWSIVRQAADLAGSLLKLLEARPDLIDLSPKGPIGRLIQDWTRGAVDLSALDIKGELARLIAGSADRIISLSGALLRNALNLVVTLAFMIFTLFFLFADGSHLARVIVGAMPIERAYTELFLRKLRETARQLLEGFFLVAIYQSLAAFILFSLFGIDAPLVLAALTSVASFVPMVGAGLVWFPVSLAVILSGNTAGGLALLALCAFFISTADNFIRPFLLQQRLQIHPLLIFFAIVGGVNLFGLNGLILGPLILILFFTAAVLFDREAEEQAARAQARREPPAGPAGGEGGGEAGKRKGIGLSLKRKQGKRPSGR